MAALTAPSPTAAGAPQECYIPGRGQGQDERGRADRPHAAAPEWLHEGEAEEPAAPGQPGPRPQPPACLQSGNVLPAPHRRGLASTGTAHSQSGQAGPERSGAGWGLERKWTGEDPSWASGRTEPVFPYSTEESLKQVFPFLC